MNTSFDDGFEETSIPEWLLSSSSSLRNINSQMRFSKEMDTLVKWLSLSKVERRVRKMILEELSNIIEVSVLNGKMNVVGSCFSGLILPDSGVDVLVSATDIKRDVAKLVNAMTVSAKYQEIISSLAIDNSVEIRCKHIYSGISIHISISKDNNTSFSGFVRFAKRLPGYKDLYRCFRYYLKNNHIDNDGNNNMMIHLLLIYYLQVTLGGNSASLSLSVMFLGLLDSISKSSLLMPSLSSQNSGFTFFGYLKSVQPKLGINLDISSKESSRIMKRISMLCENGAKTLHRFIDNELYEGRIISSIFHAGPRVTTSMQHSTFMMTMSAVMEEENERSILGKKQEDGLRLVLILLCLMLITLVFIIIILYCRYRINTSMSSAPQITLGSYMT